MKLITVDRAVLEQALEALEERYVGALRGKAMDALRAALPCTYKCEAWPECACAAQQEPTVRFKCTVVDNQNPNGVPFEQWAHKPLAGMSEMNRTIAYCAASKLRELGYEWDGKTWAALAQQEQEPVAWVDKGSIAWLGEQRSLQRRKVCSRREELLAALNNIEVSTHDAMTAALARAAIAKAERNKP